MITINNDPAIECPNANWNGITTNYCDGVSSDDVVSHEWGHAYTEYTSGLIYQWQSGALNESYSDVWGETIDLINGREDEGEGDITSPRTVGMCSTHSPANPLVTINSPGAIAKDCLTGGCLVRCAARPPRITADVVVARPTPVERDRPVRRPTAARPTPTRPPSPARSAWSTVALCAFAEKAEVAGDAGAAALIIGNRDDSPIGFSSRRPDPAVRRHPSV